MTKEEVLAFIKTNKLAVISTCANNQPEAALIGFGETDDFELIFGTFKTSRKYKNLTQNNKVAFVIGFGDGAITVQYEGVAQELDQSEVDAYVEKYHTKAPGAAIFRFHPDQSYWKVAPTWVRYSDLSGDEAKIYEFTFEK